MTEVTNDTPVEGLGHFFDTVWRDEPGYVYLPTLDRKANDWKKTMFKWPEHRDNVINHVLGNTAKGLDVYYSPVLFDRDKQPRPVKENVKGSWVVWTEYDGSAPKEWTPETAQAADGTPASPVPPPTLVVQSSKENNQHAYWQLDKFTTDTEWVENTNRSITYGTRADTSGWDINQVLRPPYTRNYKYDDQPLVTVTTSSDTRYQRERFAALKPVKQLVSDAVDTDNLPGVEGVIAKYPWQDEDFKFFMDPAIPEGKRSAALMRLGYIGAEMGMSDTELYSVLDNADARWGKYTGRSDRKIRLLDIVNRARTKHPNPTTDITFAGLTKVDDIEENVKFVYGLNEFLNSSIEVEWAIEDFIEVGGMGMVAASPGVGKTQLSIQLAIACALGKPFLHWNPVRPMKIAIFSLEMSHVALKKFMETIARSYDEDERELLETNLKLIPIGEAMPIDREQARVFLNTLLDEIKPDGIIIDSLKKLSMSKLEEDAITTINHHLGVIRKRYGCFVWLIHHNRKANGDNKEPNSLDDVYGSVFIAAEMTSVLLMSRVKDEKNVITIHNVKSRLSEEKDPFRVQRDDNLMFHILKAEDSAVLANISSQFGNVGKEDTHGGNNGADRPTNQDRSPFVM